MKLFISFFFFFVLTSCRLEENQAIDTNAINILSDTMNYSVLSYDTSDIWLSAWIFPKSKPADLDSNDINDLQSIISQCVDHYNKTESLNEFKKFKKNNPKTEVNLSSFTIDITKYKRQFIAIINDKKEKEVWVNCFSEYFGDTKLNINGWKNGIYRACDGGKNFFNFKINLTNKTYTDLKINSSG